MLYDKSRNQALLYSVAVCRSLFLISKVPRINLFNVVFPGFFDSGSFKLSNITLDIQSPIMSFKFIVAG